MSALPRCSSLLKVKHNQSCFNALVLSVANRYSLSRWVGVRRASARLPAPRGRASAPPRFQRCSEGASLPGFFARQPLDLGHGPPGHPHDVCQRQAIASLTSLHVVTSVHCATLIDGVHLFLCAAISRMLNAQVDQLSCRYRVMQSILNVICPELFALTCAASSVADPRLLQIRVLKSEGG